MSDVNVAAPVMPAGTSGDLRPSVRKGIVAITEVFEPKRGAYVSAAGLDAREPARLAAAQNGCRESAALQPSVRESTIALTKQRGPKAANHVASGELSKSRAGAAAPAVVVPAHNERVKSEPLARVVTIPAAAAEKAQRVGSCPSPGEPIRRWGMQDVKRAAVRAMENKVVMTVVAVGAAALTVFSVYKGVEMYNHYRLCQSIAEVERARPAVVHLYIHRRSPLAPSVSMPCTCVETLLRLARVPYAAHAISDPSVSPNGELPFVVFRGLRIAGVQKITDALSSELGINLDRDLTREDQATGVALLSVIRYSLTRGYMWSVHVDRPDVMQPYYSEMNCTPDWVTRLTLRCLRRRVSDVDETSGYNRLSSEQHVHELLRDVRAIEALLEHNTYLFSNSYPCSYDCALYAWLLPVVAIEDAAEVNEAFAYIVESELLTNYVRLMTELTFPDLDELVYGPLEKDEAGEGVQQQQSLTSEEEHTVISRERSKSQASSRVKRPRARRSQSLLRAAETAAVEEEEEDGEATALTPLSPREVRLSGGHRC